MTARGPAHEPASAPETAPSAAPIAAGPRLVFDALENDFGDRIDALPIHAKLGFVNAGTEELVIGDINVSCGCTVAELEQKRYAPGERGELSVEWTFKTSGQARRSITVLSNDPEARARTVILNAQVAAFVSVDPPRLSFGKVALGEGPVRRVLLSCDDPEVTVAIEELTNPNLVATLMEPADGEAGFAALEIRLRDDAPEGNQAGVVKLRLTGTPPGEKAAVTYIKEYPIRAYVVPADRN